MQIKKLAKLNLLAGGLVLASCGQLKERTVYRYAETDVLLADVQIKKTVYTPGTMKVYYSGEDQSGMEIRCYDAEFSDLGDDFTYEFQDGLLIVKADFAAKISGLQIGTTKNESFFHLRYLDSKQFAWKVEMLVLDAGWEEWTSDTPSYYTEEEIKEGKGQKPVEHQETYYYIDAE